MERVLRNFPNPVRFTLLDAEEKPLSSGDLTVSSVYEDHGTVGPGVVLSSIDIGEYEFRLNPNKLGIIEVTAWATTDDGVQTHKRVVESVDSRMFSLQELRRYDSVLTNKSYETLARARLAVENLFEDETGQSFIVRQARLQIDDWRGGEVIWPIKHNPIEVIEYTIDGVVQQPADYPTFSSDGMTFPLLTTSGSANLLYTYGMRATPMNVKRAAMKLAREIVLGNNSRIDDRAYALTIPDIGTVNLSTPGERGARTGLPEVDVVLAAYDIRMPGIA